MDISGGEKSLKGHTHFQVRCYMQVNVVKLVGSFVYLF